MDVVIGCEKVYKELCKIGVIKNYFKDYHRNHLSKEVMTTMFTVYTSKDNIENRGETIKLGLFRDQGYKVVENEARDSLRHVDGTIRMTGPVKRRQDYLYLVDCAITGTSDGTSKDPKCSLEKIFEHNIFPVIRSLVGPGGKFD